MPLTRDGHDCVCRNGGSVQAKGGAHELNASLTARLLRNMLFHEAAPLAPYFMLALPDRIYLWNLRHVLMTSDEASTGGWLEVAPKPDYDANAAPVFGPYVDGGALSLAEVGEYSLLLIVASWLTDVLNSDPVELREQNLESDLAALLFDSGLYDAAKRGTVVTETAIS